MSGFPFFKIFSLEKVIGKFSVRIAVLGNCSRQKVRLFYFVLWLLFDLDIGFCFLGVARVKVRGLLMNYDLIFYVLLLIRLNACILLEKISSRSL